MSALNVFGSALRDWWRDWVNMAMLNLGWMICWLTVVLGPPATFAAYRVANDYVHGKSLYPRELPGMFRRFFLMSWLWFLLQIAAAGGVLVNLNFYASLGNDLGTILQGATLAVAALWLLMNIYALPYLMEQENLSLGLAYRNAVLTSLASPLFTIILGVLVAGLLGLCYRLPFLLLFGVPMLIAVLGCHAVLDRLRRYGKRQERPN